MIDRAETKVLADKRIFALGVVERRICPTCHKLGPITIVETASGWEQWQCAEGHINRWRTR